MHVRAYLRRGSLIVQCRVPWLGVGVIGLTLAACGGGGESGGGGAATSLTEFAYVANSGSNDVSAYKIDATTGALTEIDQNGAMPGMTVAAGTGPVSVAVDPVGRFVFIANGGSLDVSAYAIDAADGGALRPVSRTATVSNTVALNGIAVDPSGGFVYAALDVPASLPGAFSDVQVLSINSSSGTLFAGPSVVQPTGGAASPIVDPSGRFVYVVTGGSHVSVFTIDPNTGTPAAVDNFFPTGAASTAVIIDPTGRFAYVTNSGSNDVSAYRVDTATGALTEIDQNGDAAGTTVAAGLGPVSVAVDPSGRFAYVANRVSNDISGYTIGSSGALTPLDAHPGILGVQNFPAGTNPNSITVDPSGRFVYVTNGGSENVSAYSIGSDGMLTEIPGSPFRAGVGPASIATTGIVQ